MIFFSAISQGPKFGGPMVGTIEILNALAWSLRGLALVGSRT